MSESKTTEHICQLGKVENGKEYPCVICGRVWSVGIDQEKTKTTYRRDTIILREFLPLTRLGIETIVRAFDLADMEYAPIEEWAKMFFLMRQMPDNDEHFPSGKWATIQALESKLNEWAKGVIMK